jgi:predicted ArsR family transcriptional regulator
MDLDTFGAQVSRVAALDNALSRRVYELVLDRGWVSRDTAADALQVARSVAAFHLDKLVAAGLLVVRYERTSGRTGPGAGRPAKLYGRSDDQIDLTLPPRRYELAGSLLADAASRATTDGVPVQEAISAVAREAGERIGGAASAAGRDPVGAATLIDLLSRCGYEPDSRGREIVLLNCPFHSLAQQHRDLVCGMNLDFLTGVLAGLRGTEEFSARLAPEPGHCCVHVDIR